MAEEVDGCSRHTSSMEDVNKNGCDSLHIYMEFITTYSELILIGILVAVNIFSFLVIFRFVGQ